MNTNKLKSLNRDIEALFKTSLGAKISKINQNNTENAFEYTNCTLCE